MHGALVVAALLLVSPAIPRDDDKPQPPAVAPEKVAALADAVAKALPADRRVECRVDFAEWIHENGVPAPDLAKDPPVVQSSFLLRVFGPRRATLVEDSMFFAHVHADGYQYDYAMRERSAFVDKTPRAMTDSRELGIGLGLQADLFQPLGGMEPAGTVIRTSIPISLDVDGSRWTYVYEIPFEIEFSARNGFDKKPGVTPFRRTVVVDVADPPRVLETSLELPPVGDSTRRRINRIVAEEWLQVDGRAIGRVLRREVTLPPSPRFPRGGVNIKRTVFSKVATIPADVPAPPPVADGTVVQDRKLDLEFTVGSRDIVYQKRELRLKEPLKAHPGDRLEELLKTA